MNKQLKIWRILFGQDETPRKDEIIGVSDYGELVFYNAEKGTGWCNGSTVATMLVEDEEKLNEREHMVIHALEYVGLLRMKLESCFTELDKVKGQKGRLKAINDIVAHALAVDPDKNVTNLKKKMEYIALKKALKKD